MAFLKILQCLTFFGTAFTFVSQGLAQQRITEKTAKPPVSGNSAPKNNKKADVVELNVMGSSNADLEQRIKDQLKLLDLQKPLSAAGRTETVRPLTPQKATAVLDKGYKDLVVRISSDDKINSVAVFSQGHAWYIVLGGVTDLEVAPFDVDSVPRLVSVDSLKSGTGEAILKLNFGYRRTLSVIREEKNIEIRSHGQHQANDCNDLIELPEKAQDPYRIRTRFGGSIIEFDDLVAKRSFWVLTSEKPFRQCNKYNYPEFSLLRSEMGVAIDRISEDLNIDYHKRRVEISHDNGLSVSPRFPMELEVKAYSIFNEFNARTAPERIVSLNRLIADNEGHSLLKRNIEIIWQYLGVGKVPEALSLVNLLRERYPDIALMPTFRALDGLIQMLVDRDAKAVELLGTLTYDPEPMFWYCLAVASQNDFIDTDSLHRLTNYKEHFQLLPEPLRARIHRLILQIAVLHKDCDVLDVFTEKRFYPEDSFTQQIFNLANAFIMLDHNQKNKAIDSLQHLSQSLISQRVATLATFELIKIKTEDKSITIKESLTALNRLRYSWRGDFLEYYISQYYVKELEKQKKYAKILPVLRYLVKYFPEQAHRDKLPEKMQESLLNFFWQEPPPSVMESLSIFQEYGDLAPNNEQGDQIILKATGELVRLDLYQDALDILKKYMAKNLRDDTVSSERQNSFWYKIAAIELLAKNAKKSLKTLDEIKNPAKDTIDDLALLRAEALKEAGQIDFAISSLGETPRQIEKKGELYFAKQDWKASAANYQRALELLLETDKKARAKCIFSMALCYALLGAKDRLMNLKETYGQLMADSSYKEGFNFLTTGTAFSGALTSTEFGKIESFADNLKKLFSDSANEKPTN